MGTFCKPCLHKQQSCCLKQRFEEAHLNLAEGFTSVDRRLNTAGVKWRQMKAISWDYKLAIVSSTQLRSSSFVLIWLPSLGALLGNNFHWVQNEENMDRWEEDGGSDTNHCGCEVQRRPKRLNGQMCHRGCEPGVSGRNSSISSTAKLTEVIKCQLQTCEPCEPEFLFSLFRLQISKTSVCKANNIIF